MNYNDEIVIESYIPPPPGPRIAIEFEEVVRVLDEVSTT